MARAGGGSRSGGFGSSGTSGGSAGSFGSGTLRHGRGRVSEGAPFVDIGGTMFFIGGTPKKHIKWLSFILACILALSVFSSVFLLVDRLDPDQKIDGVVYNEEVFQKYADKRYNEIFEIYGGHEDNILIIFLTNRDSNEYFCITWVGENLRKEIVSLFGDETTDFGITTLSTVQDDYSNSLDSDLMSIIAHMYTSVDSLELDSPFITDFEVANRPKSCLINQTELDINNNSVSNALNEFSLRTDIPIVITLDYMDNVFEKPKLDTTDIFFLILFIGGGVFVTFIIVRDIAKCKRIIRYEQADDIAPKKQGKDYDKSRYKKKL